MSELSITTVTDLASLSNSWRRTLRAQNKSERTIVGYTEAARLFEGFLRERGMPRVAAHIRREHVESFIEDQLDGGALRPRGRVFDRFSSCLGGLWKRGRTARIPDAQHEAADGP